MARSSPSSSSARRCTPIREELVIATKAGLTRSGPGDWRPVGRPEYLRQQCELSLRHLGLERIELYQLHRIDEKVPLAEQLGELVKLQEEGKIRHIGLSEVSVAQLQEAQKTATIVSVQNLYNLANRSAEDLLDHAEANGIGFIPWFPLNTGKLSGEAGRWPDRLRARRQPLTAGAGLAAQALAGDAPDPGHLVGRPSRGQPRGGRDRALRRAV